MDFSKHYEKTTHAIGIVFYCIELNTKYRYAMFSKFKYKNLLEACIRQVCHKHNLKIVVIKVMPEHVHMVVQASASMALSKAVFFIKGASAYLFFKHHPKARLRYPRGHLWSRGKFRCTVGFADVETEIDYILHQEEHHSSSIIS